MCDRQARSAAATFIQKLSLSFGVTRSMRRRRATTAT